MSAVSPRLSVLLTVHNGERYLEQTLASVFAQDLQDFEVVAVDDGSQDGTAAILARWAARDARLRVHRLERNLGIPRALACALQLARAPCVAVQDADDVALPGRLRVPLERLERDPGVVLVSADYACIDAHGHYLGRERCARPPAAVAFLLNFSNAAAGHSLWTYRRADALAVGGIDLTLDHSADYALAVRLQRRGRIEILPRVGMLYRVHAANSSHVHRQQQESGSRALSFRMLSDYLGRAPAEQAHAALMALWRQELRPGVRPAAQALLAEAYARFLAGAPPAAARRAVRAEFARRHTLTALRWLQRGAAREAAGCLGAALRWDARAVGREFLRLAGRALRLLLRRRAVPPSLRRGLL
jgi:GT2 family glycosyltransferase